MHLPTRNALLSRLMEVEKMDQPGESPEDIYDQLAAIPDAQTRPDMPSLRNALLLLPSDEHLSALLVLRASPRQMDQLIEAWTRLRSAAVMWPDGDPRISRFLGLLDCPNP